MADCRIKIESLGIYLPEAVLTTADLVATCRRRPRWDLERITGIHERRVARGEYAIDLAVKAAKRALALSQYAAADLDLVIVTSISKHHRPGEFVFEPATALAVRRAIGAHSALTFDVVNACAGMLTGVWIAQGLLRAGRIRRALVVSGEQNLPLAETAAREIGIGIDPQMASLTLGDCGAALILDAATGPQQGFHVLELVTGAKHNHFCVSRPSSRGPGGVLYTKAAAFQRKGSEHFPFYFKEAIDRTGWRVEDVDHVIAHQVSVRAIRQGIRAVTRFMGVPIPDDVYLCCADRYANTTTTSHFLALHEFMLRGRIGPGARILLVSGASGMVISHATMTLDDLPDRYRAANATPKAGEA